MLRRSVSDDVLHGHVGDPPLVAVLPERHDVRRLPGPRDVEGDPGRVRTAYGAQPSVVGQPGRLEQPAGEHVVLDERHRGRGSRRDAEQRGRIGPGASAAPALGRPGEPGEAELLELGPEVAVEVDDVGGRRAPAAVCREELGQHADEVGVGAVQLDEGRAGVISASPARGR